MAQFTINIEQKIVAFYSPKVTQYRLDNCDLTTSHSYTIGMDTVGAMTADSYLLNTFDRANHDMKTLHLRVLNSSFPTEFVLKYNGGVLEKGDPAIDIDVSTLANGAPIPFLFAELINFKNIDHGNIAVGISVTDTSNEKGKEIVSEFYTDTWLCDNGFAY